MKNLRIILILTAIFTMIVALMIWHVSRLQSRLIESTALNAADLYSISLAKFRTFYTSEVVKRVSKHGIEVTHDYGLREKTIPLPATLSMLLGEKIGLQTSGASSYLYSPYPFPWRVKSEQSPSDNFDEEAWKVLSENPEKAYSRFYTENNKPVLYYATADTMRPECVNCHNTHPDSPKKNWKSGDVRGVLMVRLPLSSITTKTNDDLIDTIIAYVGVGIGLVVIIGFVIIRLRLQSSELAQRVKERTAELESEVEQRNQAMSALIEAEEKNSLLLQSAGEGIYGIDLEGNTTFVNPMVCSMLGYKEDELIGQNMHSLVHHSSIDGVVYPKEKCPVYKTLNDGDVRRITDEVLWRKNETCFHVEYTCTPMCKNEKIVGAVVVFNDISERKKMEDRFRIGIEASPAAMVMVDDNGIILHINRETERLFEYPHGELIGKSIDLLVPEEQRSEHPSHRESFHKKPSKRKMADRDLLALKKNGEVFPIEAGLNPIETSGGNLVLCSVVDLTQRKKHEATILEQSNMLEKKNKDLYEQATIDSLTRVANRRSFNTTLETLLLISQRNAHPISLLLADIDFFKNYNDDFGHPAGDAALKTVAQVIKDNTRGSDFIARYGGEEFVIVLPEINQDGVLISGEKIRQGIENISSLNRKVTMSIGAATLSLVEGQSVDIKKIIDKLIEQADKAMYVSKENGRNQITHFNDI